MKRRTIVISRILMTLYIAALLYLCFGHFSSIPKVPRTIWGFESDKLVHFAMFLPFPILSYFALGHECKSIWRAIPYVLAIYITGCAIGAATELCQGYFTTYRTSDVADFKADSTALAVSSILVFLIIGIRRIAKSSSK